MPIWYLNVDGSSDRKGGGVGIVLEGPNGVIIEQAVSFNFQLNNNQAEYEALITGLVLAKELEIEQRKLEDFLKSLGIKHITSFVEHLQMNGQAEAANKAIISELKKCLGAVKGLWVEELPEVLWAYKCTPHRSTREMPFNLTYRTNAMLPVELGEPSIRRGIQDMSLNDEHLRINLDILPEWREVAMIKNAAQK
ncbi:uncharacterized protein LOC106763601 [Vigna radiata var. radiata]|uniref:Uncharacterized protein LOC106763601 n=1 Tax=Vigna radiata var. radiata TaxID=3916 RepID=A0A1S3UB52_VIGRR|nr:uncharacterized protein LOC106763601 [Vigna radiata var. radiata]